MHKIPRLYQLCLENVVENRGFWLQIQETQNANALDSLPPSLQQDLLDLYMTRYRYIGRNKEWSEHQDNWRLFVTRGICRVTISKFTDEVSLMQIAAKCRNIKDMKIRFIEEALPYLKSLAPSLATVVSLHIGSMVHVTSTCVKFIRAHCPNLRVLRLSSCFLNDKALGHLKHMAALVELDLRDTEVTTAGICQVLKNNPQLRSLSHLDVFRALYNLHSSRNWLMLPPAGGSTNYYRLREIQMEMLYKENTDMSVIVSTCPYLERVVIYFQERTSPDILVPLAGLKHLAELNIECVDDIDFNPMDVKPEFCLFDGSIVQILEACGSNMRTLILDGLQGVKMCLVERYCPQLVTLSLSFNSYDHSSFIVPPDKMACKAFPYLRRLKFGSFGGDYKFPAAYLEWLLSSDILEELSLSCSPLFTDEFFTKLFANSKAFPCLRRLELQHGNLSRDVIIGFLRHYGRKSLRELSICGFSIHQEAAPALYYIMREKLDVQLEAYFYTFVKSKKGMVRFKQQLKFNRPPCDSGQLNSWDCIYLRPDF